eukprot:2321561-Rhodomonas_salina.1
MRTKEDALAGDLGGDDAGGDVGELGRRVQPLPLPPTASRHTHPCSDITHPSPDGMPSRSPLPRHPHVTVPLTPTSHSRLTVRFSTVVAGAG